MEPAVRPGPLRRRPLRPLPTAGGITTGKGDWAWLQHTLACLNDRGRAAVVLDTGAVTRGSGSKNEDKERNIRKWFVDRDLIDGVILLPDNLFYNTTAAGVIVVLNKRKPAARKGKIVLVNASRRVTKGKPKNYIAEADVSRPGRGCISRASRSRARSRSSTRAGGRGGLQPEPEPVGRAGRADASVARSVRSSHELERLDEEARGIARVAGDAPLLVASVINDADAVADWRAVRGRCRSRRTSASPRIGDAKLPWSCAHPSS